MGNKLTLFVVTLDLEKNKRLGRYFLVCDCVTNFESYFKYETKFNS